MRRWTSPSSGPVYTGGAAAVAAAPVRWLKNRGIEATKEKVNDDAAKLLASNVRRFSDRTNADLQGKSPAEIKATLDRLGVLTGVNRQVGSDPKAKEAVDEAIVNALKNTGKATLDALARTQLDVADVRRDLASFGRDMSQYVQTTSAAADSFEHRGQPSEYHLGKSTDEHQLSELQTSTAHNAEKQQTCGFPTPSRSRFLRSSPAARGRRHPVPASRGSR